MPYNLSAAKLRTYHRCPQSYYFRYERRIKGAAFFGAAALGTALHQALAQLYWDWHYESPLPPLEWVDDCWNQQIQALTPKHVEEGRAILHQYYQQFIANQVALRRPLAVEGRIQGTLQVESLEFTLLGRYDRLDYLEDGLVLIDYKSTKEPEPILPDEIDLQLGLYYLALEQRYQRSLKRLSLIYLRKGEQISFEVTPDHRQRVEAMISELALQLRQDQQWEPLPGHQCDRCAYTRYCPAIQPDPEPLPDDAKPQPELQLVLNL